MILKTINIDGKECKFAASASIPRIYRQKFNRDIILDMSKMSDDMKILGNEDGPSNIPIDTLTTFENVAYIMAYHADNSIPDKVEDWLDEFSTFSIYFILPKLLELWGDNKLTLAVSKKK